MQSEKPAGRLTPQRRDKAQRKRSGLTSGRSHQTVAILLCAPSRLCGAPVSFNRMTPVQPERCSRKSGLTPPRRDKAQRKPSGLTSGRRPEPPNGGRPALRPVPSLRCSVSVQPHDSGSAGTMQSEKRADTAETGQGAEETVWPHLGPEAGATKRWPSCSAPRPVSAVLRLRSTTWFRFNRPSAARCAASASADPGAPGSIR